MKRDLDPVINLFRDNIDFCTTIFLELLKHSDSDFNKNIKDSAKLYVWSTPLTVRGGEKISQLCIASGIETDIESLKSPYGLYLFLFLLLLLYLRHVTYF